MVNPLTLRGPFFKKWVPTSGTHIIRNGPAHGRGHAKFQLDPKKLNSDVIFKPIRSFIIILEFECYVIDN